MAEPIRLTTRSSAEGRELAGMLARHGLPAHAAGQEVEVVSRREKTNLLLADLAVALERWLDDRQRDSIPVRAADRRLVFERSGRYRAGAPGRPSP